MYLYWAEHTNQNGAAYFYGRHVTCFLSNHFVERFSAVARASDSREPVSLSCSDVSNLGIFRSPGYTSSGCSCTQRLLAFRAA